MGAFPVYRTVAIDQRAGHRSSARPTCCGCCSGCSWARRTTSTTSLPDISAREIFTLVPIGILVLVLGVYPMPVLDLMKVTLNNLIKVVAG